MLQLIPTAKNPVEVNVGIGFAWAKLVFAAAIDVAVQLAKIGR